ncbi:hypothetical protein BG004_000502 [Podila humilis]|nr:hypothetical protein BG004_000502 [Podila humilis]
MTRPVFHALFHSLASLGYIPFALASVLVASSTPFVNLPPVGIILLAFVPPLTLFPILCFSYRNLEKFDVISLTVQRARVYIMLAGSGLCFLVGAHLIMVHMLANNHNTVYHRMPWAAPVALQLTANNPGTTLASTALSTSSTKKQSGLSTMSPSIADANTEPRPALQGDQANFNTWVPSYLPGVILNIQNNDPQAQPAVDKQNGKQGATVTHNSKRDKMDVILLKSMIPTYLLAPQEGLIKSIPQVDPHLANLSEQHMALANAVPTTDMNEVPETAYMPDSTTLAQQIQSAKESTSYLANEIRLPSQHPQLATAPSLPATLPLSSLEENPHEIDGKTEATKAGSVDPNLVFFNSRDLSPGYNLPGIHLMLFVAAHAFLIFLLATLFLGVLIMTEFVLDREDDDLVQIKWLYWGRVVGIATATIVSAVHGSLLSSYVLLDGQSDWIAKAAVGTIVFYWMSMTWLMNHITGPLPY